MGEVATTKWMRSRSPAAFNASWAAMISFSTQRASPQTRLFSVHSATARTARKSPSEITGKPASIISTPSVSSCMATCIFCSTFIAAPGHCSPSLSVVSKMCICSFITIIMLRVRSSGNCARKNIPMKEPFLLRTTIKTCRSLPSRRNGPPAHIKISSRTTVREAAIDDLEGTGCSSCLFQHNFTATGEDE